MGETKRKGKMSMKSQNLNENNLRFIETHFSVSTLYLYGFETGTPLITCIDGVKFGALTDSSASYVLPPNDMDAPTGCSLTATVLWAFADSAYTDADGLYSS